MKKRIRSLLSVIMVFLLMPVVPGTSAFADSEPAAIQDTYEIDGVTYYNTGSNNFAVDKMKFYRDLLGGRSKPLEQKGYYDYDENEWKYFDQSEGDLWLQLGAMLLTDLTPGGINAREIRMLYDAAQQGSSLYDEGNGITYSSTRYDMASQPSLKAAEEWVFKQSYGADRNYGYFKNDKTDQPVLVTAVTEKQNYKNTYLNISHTIAAYFTNFRVFAIMPAEEGTNYVTSLIKDTVNSRSTAASTVKNLTGSTVTGSQTVSNSTVATVASSVNGSEGYSYTKGVKVGAEYGFTDLFKVSGELSVSATESFAKGWESSDSVTTEKSSSYSVSIPMPPYTQAMMTQSDTTSVYLTSYNCPIALKYDVTFVMYETSQYGSDGLMHINYTYPAVNRDAVYTFTDPLRGARGDLDNRIKNCTTWNDMDSQKLRWRYILEHSPEQYDIYRAPDAIETLRTHVPMAPTGASYTQTLNIVASEVSGLMPTHPLSKINITEPGSGIYTNPVSYQLFDYYTANMEVGDYSYANYLNLVGLNKYDVPYYGFSKGNGYWVVTDKEGNQLDEKDSPVRLEKDPVSANWRYTAVRPGSCFLVYRIDENSYFTADDPDHPVTNSDLQKTAALEIIVTEKDPTDKIVINGSYQGHTNVSPESLEGDDKLTVSIYDETGKEIEGSFFWEAKELRGIIVTKDGEVSFTKDGTYHVRAVSAVNENQKSDWYEITAGHKPSGAVQENLKLATCTKAGSCDLVTYCSVCGEELNRESVKEAALGHSFDDGTITREPTEDEEGIMTYTCIRCGRTVMYNIPLTHTVTFDSNGADEVPSQRVAHGRQARQPEDPVSPMNGFVFSGWYPVKNGKMELDEFSFETPITEDLTLRARFGYDLGGAENIRMETLPGAPEIDEDNSYDVLGNILTEDEIAANFGLVFFSSLYDETAVPQEDRDSLTARVTSLGVKPAAWFDISLYKMKDIWFGDPMGKIEDRDTARMTSVAAPLKLMAEVPESLQKDGRTFYLLSCHDGEVTLVAQGKDTTLSWESDVFSTCLIAYSDAASGPGGSSGSGGTAASTYKITLPDDLFNGSVESTAKQAKKGEQITITAKPDQGYQTASLAVKDAKGNDVDVTDNGNGTFTFTMPASAVMVTPAFTKAEEPEDPTESDNPDDQACPRDDTCPITPFADTDKSEWYHDGIHWALENGIMNGTGDNSFEPLTATSRAMIVTMLWRMEGSPKVDGTLIFKDVPDGQWYTDAIRWAALNGIVNGYDDDTFGTNDSVTREQLAAVLYRSIREKGPGFTGTWDFPLDFDDADQVSEWADEAMHWMIMKGIIQGISDTQLSPQGDALRAQVATMLMRFSEILTV